MGSRAPDSLRFIKDLGSIVSEATGEKRAKGGFFSESVIRFSNLHISKKKYSKKLS